MRKERCIFYQKVILLHCFVRCVSSSPRSYNVVCCQMFPHVAPSLCVCDNVDTMPDFRHTWFKIPLYALFLVKNFTPMLCRCLQSFWSGPSADAIESLPLQPIGESYKAATINRLIAN